MALAPGQVANNSTVFTSMYRRPVYAWAQSCSRTIDYVQNFTLGSSATAHTYGTSLDVRLNSLFAPTSSGGHQPYFFDQFALIYNRYRVSHFRAVLLAVPVTDGILYEVTGLITSPAVSSTISGATTDVVLEKMFVESAKIATGGSIASCRLIWDGAISSYCGITSEQLRANTGDYSALMSASPARVPLLQLAVANLSTNAAQNVRCTFGITYRVTFFEPLVPAQS